jgi:RNA polymerase sigma factor (sigma-70 family)
MLIEGRFLPERRALMSDSPNTAAGPPLTADRVFREYAPRVYNIAYRMLGNDADAEDVTQDVLLQVVRKLDTFRGESAFPTWLHRVTVNAALAHRRKRATRQAHQASEPVEGLPGGRPPSRRADAAVVGFAGSADPRRRDAASN